MRRRLYSSNSVARLHKRMRAWRQGYAAGLAMGPERAQRDTARARMDAWPNARQAPLPNPHCCDCGCFTTADVSKTKP